MQSHRTDLTTLLEVLKICGIKTHSHSMSKKAHVRICIAHQEQTYTHTQRHTSTRKCTHMNIHHIILALRSEMSGASLRPHRRKIHTHTHIQHHLLYILKEKAQICNYTFTKYGLSIKFYKKNQNTHQFMVKHKQLYPAGFQRSLRRHLKGYENTMSVVHAKTKADIAVCVCFS